MTNEEIREDILAYRGAPFLVGEYASYLEVTWDRMNRIIQRLVREGKLSAMTDGIWTFYEVTL